MGGDARYLAGVQSDTSGTLILMLFVDIFEYLGSSSCILFGGVGHPDAETVVREWLQLYHSPT